jgi:single-strand DNA-binding protein
MSLPTLAGVGRLIDDPELRFTPSGAAVCKVRLAFNSRKKDQATGEWADGDVFFVDGTVWKDEAEHVAESLSRGMEVVVSGRMKTRQYETREGEKRSVQELSIEAIGPSLKYATAKVNKMQRSGGSGGQPQQAQGVGAGDPWSTGSAQAGPTKTPDFDSEPPF